MAEEPTGPRFQDCFNDLVERRLNELGRAWADVNARSRRAEAARRAREEMVRRIETRTGRRYATSTIARWVAHNTWPPRIDTFWFERWAAIDRAGGIDAMAAATGSSRHRVVAWRDSPDPAAPPPGRIPPRKRKPTAEPQEIGVETRGILRIGETEQHNKRIPTDPARDYEVLEAAPDSGILEAWFDNDIDTLMDLLSDAITEQVTAFWDVAQYYDARYTVTEIVQFLPSIEGQ
ncbi:hypothetical protein [Mycobacterium avium]|nr:hypothetical protein [Mycobacterium avium]MBZ4631322.1 hypothetical protein [Mycobacterium avium subsp. hominissuis]QWY65371.1 hypothetical protein BJP78_27280 [Mycobacterium avium subsp. hominissuis]